MDLGATRGPLSQKDKDHRMRNNLCLYCGKAGHKAREYKAKQRGRGTFAATQERNQHEENNDDLPQYLKATRGNQDITLEADAAEYANEAILDHSDDSDVELFNNRGKEDWDYAQ